MTSPYKEDRVNTRTQPWNTTSVTYRIPTGGFGASYGGDGRFDAGPRTQPNKLWNNPRDVGNGYLNSKTGYTGTSITGDGWDGYFIDDNTFGVDADSAPDTHNGAKWPGYMTLTSTVSRNRIKETVSQYAGLCMKCHSDSATQTEAQLITRLETEWSGHRAVKQHTGGGTAALNDILSTSENCTCTPWKGS